MAVLVAEQGIAGAAERAAGGANQPAGQRMLRLDVSLNRAYVHIWCRIVPISVADSEHTVRIM
jgi:hypothetical protein